MSEANKLTMGQELTVHVSHSVLTLMKYKGQYWLTNVRMVKYQGILCKNLWFCLEAVRTLNPTTQGGEDSIHPQPKAKQNYILLFLETEGLGESICFSFLCPWLSSSSTHLSCTYLGFTEDCIGLCVCERECVCMRVSP